MCLLHGCQDLAVNAGLDPIDRALHAQAPAIQNVRIDHRSTDVRVAEQLLDGSDVVSGFEQMCGEGVPQGVAAYALR